MKRFLCMNISIIIFIMLIFGGCGNKVEIDKNSIYNFQNYKNEEVYDIQQLNLSGNLNDSCVSYKFTYISDNYEVKAYISIPLEFTKKQLPGKCILYNRGGNSRIGLLEDEDTAKLCVATNRIIIASQYRGADGGGGRDEFGGADLNDVIKLIDLCENQFSFVDMEDFCVAGVSRGGMMTYMTAKQDNRVKRIIAISAVSDLPKAYEEREDMQKVLYNYIGGSSDEMPDEYEKRSAICWTEKITVPTLIIHSKGDEQVAFSQAKDLSDKLKLSNKNITFFTRDDDIHGLSEDDERVISDWLDSGN